MQANRNSLLKVLRTTIVVIALMFASNGNATTSATISNNMSVTSSKIHVLSWGSFWNWLFNNDRHKDHDRHGDHDGRDSNNDNGDHSDSIPLDGGLGILVLGAAAFGVKKLRGNKNDKA